VLEVFDSCNTTREAVRQCGVSDRLLDRLLAKSGESIGMPQGAVRPHSKVLVALAGLELGF
jgi:hypothetical protein